MRPKPRSKADLLQTAMLLVSRYKALPPDWDYWFPECVFLRLGLPRGQLTAGDLMRYAIVRMEDDDDSRMIEAAQCLALLHYMGSPPPAEVILVSQKNV